MAKKKQAPLPPKPGAKQLSVINLKGSMALREWLTAATRETHIPAASIVRLGLAEWAKKAGRPTPPER